MTWPLVTMELKSTNNFRIVPEIWLPTSTLFKALIRPVAVIFCVRSPRFTAEVSSVVAARCFEQPAPASRPAASSSQSADFRLKCRFIKKSRAPGAGHEQLKDKIRLCGQRLAAVQHRHARQVNHH